MSSKTKPIRVSKTLTHTQTHTHRHTHTHTRTHAHTHTHTHTLWLGTCSCEGRQTGPDNTMTDCMKQCNFTGGQLWQQQLSFGVTWAAFMQVRPTASRWISPALVQCLRWCKTERAACTPFLKKTRLQATASKAHSVTMFRCVHTHTPWRSRASSCQT